MSRIHYQAPQRPPDAYSLPPLSMPFPLDEAGLGVCHGVDDQLDESSVQDAAFIEGVVVE